MYFGIFMVNTPHDILHIVSGAMFLIAATVGERFARLWFQAFGVLYGAMAVIGFVVGEGMILGLISNNLYDAWGTRRTGGGDAAYRLHDTKTAGRRLTQGLVRR